MSRLGGAHTLRWWIGMKRLALLLSVLLGCADDGGHIGASGDIGATPGGVKDLRLARELIAQGQVPPADALLVEAMFSEHDLPITGAPCAETLCLRAAAGFAPELDGTPRGWVQVGLSSAIDPDTWAAPTTTFVYTVDVSGSMGWGHTTSPGALSKSLLHRLADELRNDDHMALVTYGSDVSTPLSLRRAETATLHATADALTEDGSTNMEAGLERAYEIARSAKGKTEQVRVILFTDVQPNVGATAASEFETMVADAAADGVHTTVLALGTGIGPEVLRAMASLRGANAFSLTKAEHVDELMTQEFPWFTTPIAYDLRVNATAGAGWSIDRGLGFPAADDASQIGLKAESVFLSKRRGALLAAFTAPGTTPDGMTGAFEIAYEDAAGERISQRVPFSSAGATLDERGHWFAQRGVARTTALALLTEAMHEAALVYGTDRAAALATMQTAHARFAEDATALGDADLAIEVELAVALTALIEQGAPQGTLYGR
jgi:Ca-activated chloride channel family protein